MQAVCILNQYCKYWRTVHKMTQVDWLKKSIFFNKYIDFHTNSRGMEPFYIKLQAHLSLKSINRKYGKSGGKNARQKCIV